MIGYTSIEQDCSFDEWEVPPPFAFLRERSFLMVCGCVPKKQTLTRDTNIT